MMRHLLRTVSIATLLLPGVPLRAQQPPTASAVLANVRREYDRVRDYTADLAAVIDMPGMKVPPMNARVWFKQPARLHLETDGFAMIPRDAVSFNPRIFNETLYDAVLQGEETVDGAVCLKVKLLAKSDTLRLQRVMLFVDPARWLILRMNTDPNQGGSADIAITYAYVDNRFFLPSTVVLRMAAFDGMRHGPMAAKRRAGNADADAGAPKKPATITLTYTTYRVNKGIPDDVFTRDTEKSR